MAIICFSRQFIFIKTRKTGGTSIQESLYSWMTDRDVVTREWQDLRTGAVAPVEEFASVGEINTAYPETSRGYFSFGFTRNPFAITLSRYRYQILMRRIPGPASRSDFNRWAREVYFFGEPGFPGGRYLLDRSRHLLFDASMSPSVSFIGRLETIAADFSSCTRKVGIPGIPLVHVNRSHKAGPSYVDWMDESTRSLVERGFDFELEYFGYQF